MPCTFSEDRPYAFTITYFSMVSRLPELRGHILLSLDRTVYDYHTLLIYGNG